MKKMSLIELINHFAKYNKMDFNKECSNKMAKLLVEKFGFEDKKDYSHIPMYADKGMIQTYSWETGDGTLFGHLDGWGYGKIEIGKAYDSNKGWFCPDFD
jgi:hypothetical protein